MLIHQRRQIVGDLIHGRKFKIVWQIFSIVLLAGVVLGIYIQENLSFGHRSLYGADVLCMKDKTIDRLIFRRQLAAKYWTFIHGEKTLKK
uniref:Uncharacterized protein n=1 Tax=Romanomermis culicivorax TaxID=13658 RepID=A0A915JQE0_ROMCU